MNQPFTLSVGQYYLTQNDTPIKIESSEYDPFANVDVFISDTLHIYRDDGHLWGIDNREDFSIAVPISRETFDRMKTPIWKRIFRSHWVLGITSFSIAYPIARFLVSKVM
jgi:hypothetical protein